MADIPSREITPAETYFNRRAILRGGIVAAGAVGTGALYRMVNGVELDETLTEPIEGIVKSGITVDEELTPYAKVANYNNFYEFSTDKDGVAKVAKGFDTRGWTLAVDGRCHKPRTFDVDGIRRLAATEERVYRFRCVEAWSMVIPWAGFSLSKLLAAVEPMADAKYVAFQTLADPKRMPGLSNPILSWPYSEGYTLAEAMHPLTMLCTGLYGRELPAQNGAPVRIVIPWKYGFKNIKSIVKMTFVKDKPPTSWNLYGPDEYGFYANVNPTHDHPRWSQATEQRIGESGRRKTLMFNGYADQVASLYGQLDLHANF